MSAPATVLKQGSEPARSVVALAVALALTAVVVNRLFTPSLTFFFDLCFIAICAMVAWRIEPRAFMTAALTPPALLASLMLFLAIVSDETIADEGDSVVQAFVSGIAHHAFGFAIGYACCLALLRLRTVQARAARTVAH